MSLREKLLATRTRFKVRPVQLRPELAALVDGEQLFIREMSAGDLGTFEAGRFQEVDDGGKRRAKLDMTEDRQRLVARCLCDADGKRQFADDDLPALALVNGPLLDQIYVQAVELNRLNDKDRDKELEKNSTPPAGSGASDSASALRLVPGT